MRDPSTTHRPSTPVPVPATPRPRPTVVTVVLALAPGALLASCGLPASPASAPHLECVILDYPCSFADMDEATISRSMDLADAVAAVFEEDGTTADALELLGQQPDVAYAGTDGHAVLFRLDGGGPVVVDPTIDDQTAPGEEDATSAAAGRASAAGPGAAPSAIVGGSGGRKKALVLSPFQHDFTLDTGNAVAALLAATPGYEGGVTFRATTSPANPVVGVDDFLGLEAYDVIYISTHGGALCLDAELGEVGESGYPDSIVTGSLGRCRSDFLVQRFHGTPDELRALEHVGVVLYRGSKFRSIAITADFFRHYYPNGLANRLAVLLACSTFSRSFSDAIPGGLGVFVSWDLPVHEDKALVTLEMMQLLAEDGLTVSEALDELGPKTTDPGTGARLRSTGATAVGDLRIRDLVSARDAIGGDDLRTAVEIDLVGAPDDGVPDRIELDVRVLGVTDVTFDAFRVQVKVNGATRLTTDLADRGSWVAHSEVYLPLTVDLGFDAKVGEPLDIVVTAFLPEGGVSEVTGSPRVRDGVGAEIVGTLRWESEGIDWTQTIVADVRFVRDPSDGPGDAVQVYLLDGGSFRYSLVGTDARTCTVSGSMSAALAPSGSVRIQVDTRSDPPLVTGFGHSQTESLTADVVCPDGEVGTQLISTNVAFLYIPSSGANVLEHNRIVGDYAQGTQAWEWALELR